VPSGRLQIADYDENSYTEIPVDFVMLSRGEASPVLETEILRFTCGRAQDDNREKGAGVLHFSSFNFRKTLSVLLIISGFERFSSYRIIVLDKLIAQRYAVEKVYRIRQQ
jgi:hypothetical protein